MRPLLFLLLALGSLFAVYIGVRPTTRPAVRSGHVHATEPATKTEANASANETVERVDFDQASAGYAVYRTSGCKTCHGNDGLGTRMGPSLAEARLNYDRESLIQYLHDPEQFATNSARLQEMASRYPRSSMPDYPRLKGDALESLVRFVLEPAVR